MAKRPEAAAATPPRDHNEAMSAEDMKAIEDATAAILGLEKRRESINADIASERAKIKALGVNMDAWRASFTRSKMDPDKRDEFDRSRLVCDQALGIPVQGDLFAEEEAEDGAGGIPSNLN